MKRLHNSRAMRAMYIAIFVLTPSPFSIADDAHQDKWNDLLKRTPYIYTVPVVPKRTPIDGTYVKKAKKVNLLA